MQHEIKIGNFVAGNNLPLFLIAGPCQMESEEHAMMMATELKSICEKVGINFVFKTSFDKANRTSIKGKRGIGFEESLPIFAKIRETLNVPILTDVHEISQCEPISKVVDILQIPAFLSRQTDLIAAAARTGKIVNIKKGQFMAPADIGQACGKVEDSGNKNIFLTERGVSFGYNNLVVDMRSFPIMASTGYPVIFDATHSVQIPSGQGGSSGGKREYAPPLARAAVAIGIAGVFIETHEDPDNAPSDGPNMIPLKDMPKLLEDLIKFDRIAKSL